MFYGVPDDIAICINENNNENKIFPQIINKTNYKIDCDFYLEFNSVTMTTINEIYEYISYYEEDSVYKYRYQIRCYDYSSSDINNSRTESEKYVNSPQEISNVDLCSQCNDDSNYYPMENNPLNEESYINCYKNPKGYYLDTNNSVYKKCYESCEDCDKREIKILIIV